MARKITLNCDFCGKEIEQVAAKIYLSPVLPGKAQTSFMSGYSHYADVCAECKPNLEKKMKRRQPRNGNNSKLKKTARKRKAAV